MALIGQGAMPVGINYTFGEDAWRAAGVNSAAIGQALGTIGDVVKDRREKKDTIKTSKELAKAMATLYPESAGALQPVIDQLDDEEMPLSERAALGKNIGEFINLGVQKSRDNALMNLETQRLGLEGRRVAIAEQAPIMEAAAANSTFQLENETKLQEAISKFTTISEAELAAGDKVPQMKGSVDRIMGLIEQGDGESALAAVDAYSDMRKPQLEKVLSPEAFTLTEIADTVDGQPVVRDVFTTPSGGIFDLNRVPINDGMVLPPRPDVPGEVPQRRTVPMPPASGLGIRPAGEPRTPEQIEKERLQIQKLQGDVKQAESDLTKATDAKATARASAENALTLIQDLRKHPGFGSAVGMSAVPGFIPATDRKGAEAIIDQLKGQAFLTAIQQLRGLGALSDAEGAKLQQAAVRLDPGQSEEDFKKALSDYESEIAKALSRLRDTGENQSATDPRQSAADRLRALQGR